MTQFFVKCNNLHSMDKIIAGKYNVPILRTKILQHFHFM